MSNTNSEIDELAENIERQIQKNTRRLKELSHIDPKWRRMEEAPIPDPDEIFG